jgi:glutamate-ammonia-ligase adenylyltransferase
MSDLSAVVGIAAWPAPAQAALPRVLAASRFVRETLAQPGFDASGFAASLGDGALAQTVLPLAQIPDEPTFMRMLRQLRRASMARIAFRDLALLAPLDETLGDLSDLADACCEAALRFVERRLQERHGVPRTADGTTIRPVVFGMGKLGGRELNFSSDIDLIFCHTEVGETDGARCISSDEYFPKLAQDVSRLLSSRTEDGFVFRVDTMLRPFGSAGALSASFAAMEDYYQVHGREWERYALIKARPIAGDIEAGHELLRALRPFVYRRYLDYNAIGNLRDLKRMIEDEVRRKGLEDNIKLGAGGIRELEFIVQSFQLVRGGQEASLRDARLRPVLAYLGETGHLTAEIAARLDRSYVFLRRVENAIQMYADEQAHALPAGEEARNALVTGLGYADWPALIADVDAVRHFVQDQFQRVFATDESVRSESPLRPLVDALWNGMLDGDAALEALYGAGFRRQTAVLLQDLGALRSARLVRGMRDEAVQKLIGLVALLAEESLELPQPEIALQRTLKVLHAVAGRTTYLTLLREGGAARSQLLRLCAASPWLTDFIAQSPVLLDTLLDPRTLYEPPDREELFAELRRRCAEFGPQDTEAAMDTLRRYQKEVTLRVAAADLVHALPLVKVSDRLTWLAEAIVAQALEFAWTEMRAQYGQPMRSDGQPAGFAVIGYGKLGGIELGYGSDLDLVFLHDCDQLDQDSRGGDRSIDNGTYFARLAQRLINWLATQTPAGRAYEVDMELRPNGRSGLLVSSLSSFVDYQRNEAWTWEHQALTRSRPVAGSSSICDDFARARIEVLGRERDVDRLRRDISDMRAKMRANLDKSSPERWDIKQGAGGLIDLEFITQYLVLRDGRPGSPILEWSDNWRQLEALESAGFLPSQHKSELIDCYRRYRAWVHARALQQEDVMAPASAFAPERALVVAHWQRLFSPTA